MLRLSVVLGLSMVFTVPAWQTPDTTALKKKFQVRDRESGKPVVWEPLTPHGTGLKIRLIWRNDSIIEARYIQSKPFSDQDMMSLAAEFGGGGTWHELPDPSSQSLEAKAYPGIVQHWQLEGFGGNLGWSGAGVATDQFFVVFRKNALSPEPTSEKEFDIRADFFACQDSLTGWLKEKCPIGWEGLPPNAQCFSPSDNPRRHLALIAPTRKNKTTHWIMLWQESDGLKEIAQAMERLPAGSESSYAEDLARILGGESLTILSRLAQLNPCLFNQPSWAISRLQKGYISPSTYFPYLGKKAKTWDWLPGLSLPLPKAKLQVDISLGGTYQILAIPNDHGN
jgi:hypothetical protein